MSARGKSTMQSAGGANCPDPQLLKALARGELADELLESIGAHVDACVACQDQLGRLTVIDNLLQEARGTGNADRVAKPKSQEPPHPPAAGIRRRSRSTRLWLVLAGAMLVVTVAAVPAIYLNHRAADSKPADGQIAHDKPVATRRTFPAIVQTVDLPTRQRYAEQLAIAAGVVRKGDGQRALELLADTPRELRGWEWDRLTGLCNLADTTLIAGVPVAGIDYHPGGRQLAAALNDGRLQIWDVSTPRRVREWQAHESRLNSVAWRPDGVRLASAGEGGSISIWDPAHAQLERSIATNQSGPLQIAWSPDGKWLFSFAFDALENKSAIKKWDAATGDRLLPLNAGEAPISLAATSPDGRWLLTAGRKQDSAKLDPLAQLERKSADGQSGVIETIAWSTDARLIAMSGGQARIRITPVDHPERGNSIRCDAGETTAMMLSPDGRILATIEDKLAARLRNLRTGETLGALVGHSAALTGSKWSPSGQSLATADATGHIKIWSLDAVCESDALEGLASPAISLSWHPRGELIAVGTSTGDVAVWGIPQRRLIFTNQIRQPDAQQNGVVDLAWSPNGKRLAVVQQNGLVTVWDDQQGLSLSSNNTEKVRSVAWSPDGKLLATCGDSAVRLWNSVDAKLIRVLATPGQPVAACVISPEGRQVSGLDANHQVRVWELSSGRMAKSSGESTTAKDLTRRSPSASDAEQISTVGSLSWSHHGNRLAWIGAGGSLVAWNVDGAEPPRVLPGDRCPVRTVAWHPDGQRLATGDKNGTIRIWDQATGAEFLAMASDQQPINRVAWNSSGNRLATLAVNGAVRIYHAGRPPSRIDRAPTLELNSREVSD